MYTHTRTRTRTEAATQAAKVKAEPDGGAPASAAAATTDISSGEFRSRVTQAGDAAEEATGARTRTHTNGISTGLLFRTAAADHGHLHPTQSKSAEACLQRPVSLPKAVSRGTQLG